MNDFPTIALLGRQPLLGITELESLYGAENVQPYGNNACLLSLPASEIDFDRLGGTIRLAGVLATLKTNAWHEIAAELEQQALLVAAEKEGKLVFGISTFNAKVSSGKLAKTALTIKKAIKQSGASVRMVPQKDLFLGTAVVLNNKLHRGGLELLVITNGNETIIARTDRIQDIDAYTARDRERPMRDAKVGMLPPKLAQIIINLSVGKINSRKSKVESQKQEAAQNGQDRALEEVKTGASMNSGLSGERATAKPSSKYLTGEIRAAEEAQIGAEARTGASGIEHTVSEDRSLQADMSPSGVRILDPFCGTGVLLQEAMLMDYDIYGTDLVPRMIQYSIENLQWLDTKYPDVGDYRRVEVGDATTFQWNNPSAITNVAAETYLGQPLSSLPPSDQLSKIMHEVNNLHHKFLQNLSKQLTPGTRICLAVPTWRGKREFLHLSALDYLDDLGYTRVRFEYADNSDLIYHRENQVVGRELLVLIKN